jgi:hypothetical protein
LNYWLFSGGILLAGLVLVDALWTTLWPDCGAGPLTNQVGTRLWQGFKRCAVARKSVSHRLLSAAGPGIMVAILVMWLVVIWLGWFMIFSSSANAVITSQNTVPASFSERAWYVLSTTSTLGNTNFVPGSGLFEIMAGLAAVSGIGLLTMWVAYMVQVLAAIVDKRAFATAVLSLGEDIFEIVETLRCEPPNAAVVHLAALSDRLSLLTEQHEAYPILHYFHPIDKRRSTARAVAMLDEALRIYVNGVNPESPTRYTMGIHPLRRSIGTFLQTLSDLYLSRTDEPADADEDALRRLGVEGERGRRLHQSAREHVDRRRLLAGLVEYDGWKWDDVILPA